MCTRFIISLLFSLSAISINAQWISKKDASQFSMWGNGYSIKAASSGFVAFAVNPAALNIFSALYITENNGHDWNDIPLLPTQWGLSITDIAISSNLSIWITSADGELYRTTDKGNNWTKQFYDTAKTKFMNYIKMFDNNNGIAMGDAVGNQPALFISTTNGGTKWNIINNNLYGYYSADQWRRLDFVDMNNGYFNCRDDNLLKTTDGGLTWNKTNHPGNPWRVKFYNTNLGLTFVTDWGNYPDYKNYFKRTTDGGTTWEAFPVDIPGWGCDIEFLPGKPSFVWFTGEIGLYYSADTGATWQRYNLSADSIDGRDIVFTDANHGWLLCDNGNIYYTENNGGIIDAVNDDNPPTKTPVSFTLFQNYPNPFNPSTTIKYQIPVSSKVTLKVFNLLGNEIAALVDEHKEAGTYTSEFNASKLASGVYFYKLQAGKFITIKKLLLIK
jgi:photosystem II stability/assembly factor-like uncharacterized protein